LRVIVVLTLLLLQRAFAAEGETQRVDRLFAAFDKRDSPGCALGVVRDGDFSYRKGYGMGSLELSVPLDAQSVFYMGSVSKQFTAASVGLAAEQGLLSLDDDIRKHIPEITRCVGSIADGRNLAAVEIASTADRLKRRTLAPVPSSESISGGLGMRLSEN
jgi:CubicO group peptidase (beta-lactamase class C family)